MPDSSEITVSVIVPVYNAGPYLNQCLESLCVQTLPSMEFILINDASTDESGEICDQYAALDTRFRVFHNRTNQKQANCLNHGLKLANGEYVGTVDGDDWVDSVFFERLYQAAEKAGADISKGSLLKHLPSGTSERQNQSNKKIKKGLKRGYPLVYLFNHEVTTAIYRRSLIEEHQITFAPIPNGLDIVFLLNVCWHTKSIVFVKHCYYHYRIHPQSISRIYSKKYYGSILDCFREHLTFANTIKSTPDLYYYLFCKGLMGATRRYHTFGGDAGNQELKKEYTRQILEIIKGYQADQQLLLQYLFYGMIRQQQIYTLRQTIPFRITTSLFHYMKTLRQKMLS